VPKILIAAVVVGVSLGIAFGLSGWQSASVQMKIHVASTVFFGGLALFTVWLWSRADRDSPDKDAALTLMMVSGTQLLWHLPRVIAPEGGWVRAVGYGLALCATAGLLVWLYRRRRRRQTVV